MDARRKALSAKRNPEQEQVSRGGANVFAELGFPDAEELQTKAELTRQIRNRIQSLKLTQVQAGKRLSIGQPDVSKLMNGRYAGFSVDRLFDLLNALAVDVTITLKSKRTGVEKRGVVRISGAG